jgi:tRNA (guanine37-N1)-methyltransferase
MVMKPEPVRRALEFVRTQADTAADAPLIMMTPGGRPFSQAIARELSQLDHLILLCGHYEGIDERVRAKMVTDEISIGDYVLTGGELPAMVVVDAAVRLIPGVLGDFGSTQEESFGDNLLEYPQYTRPPAFEGLEVPNVLRSGDHESISRWRRKESLRTTEKLRPDLLGKADLSALDRILLDEVFEEESDGLDGES